MKKFAVSGLMVAVFLAFMLGSTWQPTTVTAQEDIAFELLMGDPATGEFSFSPDVITLKNKVTTTFRLKNVGQLPHELRSDLFRTFPFDIVIEGIGEIETVGIRDMDLEPGKEVLIKITPNISGKVLTAGGGQFEWLLGCFIEGHFEAGMKGKIIVTQ